VITLLFTTLLGYLFGSIPFGLVWVRLFTGKDVREVGSGRTGGTNVMRAAGFWVGLLTALSDIGKGAVAVMAARALLPTADISMGMVLAGLAAIVGHNYPIWLRFKGGAGGATCAGAALVMWPWLGPILIGLGALILYFIGYASIATISVAVTTTVVFAILAWWVMPGAFDPIFVLYGLGAIVLLAWSLRPNFRRLIRGEERMVGRRAKKKLQSA
jgi:glycerol-3-phosphate acyltransferase PlsY